MLGLLACTRHAQGMLFSFSPGTRNTVALAVGGLLLASFMTIVVSNGNRRIERAGYIALVVVLVLGGGVLMQGELKPINDWG